MDDPGSMLYTEIHRDSEVRTGQTPPSRQINQVDVKKTALRAPSAHPPPGLKSARP